MPNELSDTPRDVPSGAPVGTQGPPTAEPARIAVQREGPFLLDGPVEVTLEDGSTVRSDRFRVALCTCRRSRRYPWCDTSHRRRTPE